MAKNNRALGLNVERAIINLIASFFGLLTYNSRENKDTWQIASSRAVSKVRDDEGVDLIFRKCPTFLKNKAIQIKRTTVTAKTTTNIDIQSLLRVMELDENTDPVLITRVFQRVGKVNRNQGDFVTIPLEDYLKLLKDANHTPA